MKKFLVFVLAVATIFTFTACGGSGEVATTISEETTAEPTTVQETTVEKVTQKINGYKEYSFSDIKFEAPDDWEEVKEEGLLYLYPKESMFMISDSGISESIEDKDVKRVFLNGFGMVYQKEETGKLSDGRKFYRYDGTMRYEEEQHPCRLVLFDGTDSIIACLFIYVDNALYDYTEAFDDIVNSIQIKKEEETTIEPTTVEETTIEEKTEEETTTDEETEAVEVETQKTPSLEETNALRQAQKYLDFMAFSATGLIDQLEFEGYSNEAATWAVENCGADWNEQAAKKAQSYLDAMAFSRDGLYGQLEYEGFTAEEIEYALSAVGY